MHPPVARVVGALHPLGCDVGAIASTSTGPDELVRTTGGTPGRVGA